MPKNRKHLFVLPVPCDFSENATDTILPMVLKNSQGNIIIESDANLCSSNNLPIANNSPACAADSPTIASSGINNANASASVNTYVGNGNESDLTFSGASRDSHSFANSGINNANYFCFSY